MVETKHVPDWFILDGTAVGSRKCLYVSQYRQTEGCGQTEPGQTLSKLQQEWAVQAD